MLIQGVWMKGIQNKKIISRKLIVLHISGLCHRKGKLKDFFHAWLTRMRQLVTFGELSNNVDITGTGLMRIVASRVTISPVQCRFRTQYGGQPPGSGTTN
jgi:hypothetical protein